jgi:hypothetical protein
MNERSQLELEILARSGEPKAVQATGLGELTEPEEWIGYLSGLPRSYLVLAAYLPLSWIADEYFPFTLALGRWLHKPTEARWISLRERGRQLSEQYIDEAHRYPERENLMECEYQLLGCLRGQNPGTSFLHAASQFQWDWIKTHHQEVVRQALAEGLPMRASATWPRERLPKAAKAFTAHWKQSLMDWLGQHPTPLVPEPAEAGW